MKRVLLLLLAFIALACGCGSKVPPALVTAQPTAADVADVRRLAATFAINAEAGLKIVNDVGTLVAAVPGLKPEQRDGYDCALLRVIGTNGEPRPTTVQACGQVPTAASAPFPTLTRELQSVTTCPSLRATLTKLLGWIDPLIERLTLSDNAALTFAAGTLRTTFSFARKFLESGGTCSQ